VSLALRLWCPQISARTWSHAALQTSAYVSIRQHMAAYGSIRQHTAAYGSIRQHTGWHAAVARARLQHRKQRALPRSVCPCDRHTHKKKPVSINL
jgi:hypothetical protein